MNDLYFAYDKLSRSPEELAAFLDNWVHGVPGREAYLKKLGGEAKRRLTGQSGPVASVSYGFEARDV